MRSQYPAPACWAGLDSLTHSLRSLAGSRPDLPVLIAPRSAQLMKLASRLLFRRCRHVLVTDLGWPGYHAILEAECRRSHARITVVPLRDRILDQRVTEEEVIDVVSREYRESRCDGLFLTAVSNLGIRLPVALGPLFSCQGAVADACEWPERQNAVLATRHRNAAAVAGLAGDAGWRPVLPDTGLRSGILLARANRAGTRRAEPEAIRVAFRDRAVMLTTHADGLIRLSMPAAPLSNSDVYMIQTALRQIW